MITMKSLDKILLFTIASPFAVMLAVSAGMAILMVFSMGVEMITDIDIITEYIRPLFK